MLNTPSDTTTVATIAQHAKWLKANTRLQLMQHVERLLSAEGDLVTRNQLRQQ